MAVHWVRQANSVSGTTARTFNENKTIYQNSRATTGNITLVQKVTVVSTYLFGVTNTEDTWSMTLCVVDEDVTPDYNTPEIFAVGGSDPEVKGQFLFARGPSLYVPKRLIEVPVESKLVLRINKEEGGNNSILNYGVGFLFQTSL